MTAEQIHDHNMHSALLDAARTLSGRALTRDGLSQRLAVGVGFCTGVCISPVRLWDQHRLAYVLYG